MEGFDGFGAGACAFGDGAGCALPFAGFVPFVAGADFPGAAVFGPFTAALVEAGFGKAGFGEEDAGFLGDAGLMDATGLGGVPFFGFAPLGAAFLDDSPLFLAAVFFAALFFAALFLPVMGRFQSGGHPRTLYAQPD